MKFAFYTLGCKVNLFETQALTRLALERGHTIVERDADAVIVNTCTVTSVSDHKNIRAFHKLRRDNPHAVIAACGCFSEAEPERVRATGEIDIVCGTCGRAKVIELCESAVKGESVSQYNPIKDVKIEPLPAGVPAGRTRALLKIEDGCDNYCTYCIIPYTRGHVRSLPPEDVALEAARLEREGAYEIVLTGIEIASYGIDLDPVVPLGKLVSRLLCEIPRVRFRLGSLDPRAVDDKFCQIVAPYPNLARHFHLSLQSGCDSVLQRMHRRYNTEHFYRSVKNIRRVFPDCSVTTDLIVGFPGETEIEFEDTLKFIEHCEFASVHVFPFSARKGTRAAAMAGQLSTEVKSNRAVRARAVAAEMSERYRRGFIGKTLDALPEHYNKGIWSAHGTYNFPIYINDSALQKNCPVKVSVTGLCNDGVRAKIIPPL